MTLFCNLFMERPS